MPSCRQITASPSIRNERALIVLAASTIAGNRSAQSYPPRVNRRTREPSRRAMSRKPSCLISCTQSGPDGGRGVLDGRHGSIRGRPEGGTLTQQHGAKIGEKIGRRESRNQKNCGHGGQKSWPISGAPPGSTLKAEFHKRIQLKIGRVKPHRVVSGASDFRNDSWAQALKNISALSGCLYRAAEEMECRPRNFTKDA